jgi:hypothetical protein
MTISHQSHQQAGVGGRHGLHLAAGDDVRALGQRGFLRRDDPPDIRGHRTEIAALHGAEQVDDGLGIVTRDHARAGAARYAGHGAEDLRLARHTDRHILQVIERGHAVLRRLGHDRILHAGLGVQPERGCYLATPRERQQQVAGDVPLADAQLHGPATIGHHP